MIRLEMTVCSIEGFRSRVSPRLKSRAWRIWAADENLTAQYPPKERILLLAQQHMPAYGMEVLDHREQGGILFVRLPVGATVKCRAAFLRALEKEIT